MAQQEETAPVLRCRLDKWLWVARFFRTRRIAAEKVSTGKIRVNAVPVCKPGYGLKQGDVLTIARHPSQVCVVEVVAFSERRLPATEAVKLYQEYDTGLTIEP